MGFADGCHGAFEDRLDSRRRLQRERLVIEGRQLAGQFDSIDQKYPDVFPFTYQAAQEISLDVACIDAHRVIPISYH